MVSPTTLTILVADQDPVERSLIRNLVDTLGWSAAEASSVRDMTSWLRTRPANDTACVLVSYPFLDGDAFDALAASQAIRADFPVVLLSDDNDADVVLRLLNSGAAGYLERNKLSKARLAQAVRRAMRSTGASGFGDVMKKVCHDLRNPLSAIMINANILSREAAMPNERRVKLATRIVSSATRMNRMLEDFFDYAVASQGKALSVRLREADLKLVAAEALAEVRAEHPGRTLDFEPSGDLRGQWDPSRLRQMLHILLGLALKRGSTRASLAVECSELQDPPGIQVRISIKHDSLNVDLTMSPQSAPEPAEDNEPGLYVARRIVEAHQGTFEVPAAGDATTFIVRLPKAQTTGDEKAATERLPPSP